MNKIAPLIISLVLLAVLIITALRRPPAQPPEANISSQVNDPSLFPIKRIVSGSVILVVVDGQITPIKLFGIESPEISTRFGAEARDFLAMEAGTAVKLSVESIDDFGRSVATVHNIAGALLSESLVRQGYATCSPTDTNFDTL